MDQVSLEVLDHTRADREFSVRTYFLLEHYPSDRLVISEVMLPDSKQERSIEASCWIEAKKKLGFPLTGLQEYMLNEKNNRNKAGRRSVRNVKDAGSELWTAYG